MTTPTAVDELHRLTDELRRCVSALHTTLGDTTAMRRVVNDAQQLRNSIDRLGIDLAELGAAADVVACPRPVELIQISDVDYDLTFWRDVDHEGVGGQSLAS
jgi:hypothetical protein